MASKPATPPHIDVTNVSFRVFVAPTAEVVTVHFPSTTTISSVIEAIHDRYIRGKDGEQQIASLFGLYLPIGERKELKLLSRRRLLKDYNLPPKAQLIFKIRAASVLGFDATVASSTATEASTKKDSDSGGFDEDGDDIEEPVAPHFSWLVCSLCNEAVKFDNLENHTRFCKLKQNSSPTGAGEKRRLRNEDPVKEYRDKIEAFFDQFDGALHLLLASVISFWLGSIGLSFAWCFFILVLIYRMDKRIKQRGYVRMIHEYERRERERKENSVEEESCEWFNLMLEKFWPTLSIMLNSSIKRWLDTNLAHARPSSVDKFDVNSVSVGPYPPLVSHMRGIRVDREQNLWVAEFDALWHPDAEVGLTAHLASLPGESSNGLFKLPVKLKDLSCDGRMQVSLRFIPAYPYLDIVQVAFKTRPQIDLGVQLLNVVEIMDISFLSDTLTQALNTAIAQYLVLPHSIKISLKQWYAPDDSTAQAVETHTATPLEEFGKFASSISERFFHPDLDESDVSATIVSYMKGKYETAMNQAKAYKKSQRRRQKILDVFAKQRKDKRDSLPSDIISDVNPNIMESFYDLKELMEKQVRNSKKESPQAFIAFRNKKKRPEAPVLRGRKLGHLKTAIIEACDLVPQSRFAQFPDAYCIACVGDQYFKTDVIKSSATPSWNTMLEFNVYEGEKKKLYIQVMDSNMIDRDDFLGRESVDFADLLHHHSETIKMWVHLKGVEAGQVHLSLTFYPH